jgi:hypothetical protein
MYIYVIVIPSQRSLKESRTSFKIKALYTLLRTESRLTVTFSYEVCFLVMVLQYYAGGQRRFDICSLLNSAFKIEVACISDTLSTHTRLHVIVIGTSVTQNLIAINTSKVTSMSLRIAPESCVCGRWFLLQILVFS